jgi:hypothetical protein
MTEPFMVRGLPCCARQPDAHTPDCTRPRRKPMTDLDDQEYLIRGAVARALGDLIDSDAETLVQNVCAITVEVMEALHGPPPWTAAARDGAA